MLVTTGGIRNSIPQALSEEGLISSRLPLHWHAYQGTVAYAPQETLVRQNGVI